MAIWIKAVDPKWLEFVSAHPHFDEINLWNPTFRRSFVDAETGDLVLFRPDNRRGLIAGYGTFFNASVFFAAEAWEIFDQRNGFATREEFFDRIAARRTDRPASLYPVACHDIVDPVYFDGSRTRLPPAVLRRLGEGPVDEASADGSLLLSFLQEGGQLSPSWALEEISLAGAPRSRSSLHPKRAGFRIAVTEAYGRACAITAETALPCLDAVHWVADRLGGPMDVRNASLLRRDFHPLVELGFMAVGDDDRVMVSAWLPSTSRAAHITRASTVPRSVFRKIRSSARAASGSGAIA